jgi:serine/threonine protein kinase
MKNCGGPMYNINRIKIKKNQLTEFIKNIFIQCLESLKLIHDVNYLHLDIKPDNFLYSIKENNLETLQIKIIDFGFSKPDKYNTSNVFGTADTIPCDWLKNILIENPSKNIILEKHHDLFELGCTFLKLIFFIINTLDKKIFIPYIVCPISYEKVKIFITRANYSESEHISNMNTIKEYLKKLEMNEEDSELIRSILYGMCNPDPNQRFENCDSVLSIVKKINIQNNSLPLLSTEVIQHHRSPPHSPLLPLSTEKKEFISLTLPNGAVKQKNLQRRQPPPLPKQEVQPNITWKPRHPKPPPPPLNEKNKQEVQPNITWKPRHLIPLPPH